MLVVTEAVQERQEDDGVIMTATFISNLLLKWQLGHILGQRGEQGIRFLLVKIFSHKSKEEFVRLGCGFH